MKISLNTLRFINRHYGSAGDPAPDGVEVLVQKIGAQLGAVEETIDYGSRFEGVIIARVVSCESHPDADRLHVCKLDDGGVVQGVDRDENGYVQVVCGAPNVREGLLVAWLPPGTTVPESQLTEPFVLAARPLRGVMSNGMLASPRELTIGDKHEGILEVALDVAPGTPFAEATNLAGEAIIDIENKMFTHRPDCFGMLGVARELEGIQHRPYKSPDWYTLHPNFPAAETDPLPITVRNEVPAEVRRFMIATMRDVKVKPSPLWLQIYLSQMGIRSINNIVDYTNFFMLETGQPLHAYDYDKVMAQDPGATQPTLVIRYPKEGERITLLNGKEIKPRPEAIMIATASKLIGVGGVMGGADTEVDDATKNIILECASFDMYSIRRTSMAHGLFTDAVTRNNKGPSPLQNPAVLAKIIDEIRRFADGKLAGEPIDDNHLDAATMQRGALHPPVKISAAFINARLGLQLTAQHMALLLANVEFDVVLDGDDMIVTAPFWRTDIEIPEDIVEEVGRLYGFDQLPQELPRRSIEPAIEDPMLAFKARLRTILSSAGANEALTYSFVHGKLLEKVGQNPAQAFQLSNALSPDLQYYRLSLAPSLLDKVHANIKAGHDVFGLFELGKVHVKGSEEAGLPREFDRLAFVFAADDKAAKAFRGGAPYYQAQAYLRHVLSAVLGKRELSFEPIATSDTDVASTYYAPGRAAIVKLEGKIIGRIGEYKTSVRKALKLPDFCAGFELGLGPLLEASTAAGSYMPLSRYPAVEQDICLKVDADIPFAGLQDFIRTYFAEHQSKQAVVTVSPVDIYQRPEDQEHKQMTFRILVVSYEKTLRQEEVSKLLDGLAAAALSVYDAQRI